MNYSKIKKGWFDYQSLYLDLILTAPKGSTILELGTFAGKSFAYLFEAAVLKDKPLRLVTVDNYSGAGGLTTTYEEALANIKMIEDGLRKAYPLKLKRFYDLGGSCELIKANSLELDPKQFKPLYAVFCDTDHDYFTLISELLQFYPELVQFGSICGHDYNPSNPNDFPDVQLAVNDFAAMNNLTVIKYNPRSFRIIKP